MELPYTQMWLHMCTHIILLLFIHLYFVEQQSCMLIGSYSPALQIYVLL